MDRRRAKLGKLLMEEIATMVHQELKDSRLEGVVITYVELSSDMQNAKVYFTTLEEGKEAQAQKALNSASGYIRAQLMKKLKLKHLPLLTFVFDKELKRMEKIWEKL